jgi:hypothetical protein
VDYLDTVRLLGNGVSITIEDTAPPTIAFNVTSASGGGAQAQLTNLPSGAIANGAAIPFNQAVFSGGSVVFSGPGFTVLDPGYYYVSWQAAVGGVASGSFINLALRLNGSDYATVSSAAAGQASGSAFFEAPPGTAVELYNTSGGELLLGTPPVQANMVVMKAG